MYLCFYNSTFWGGKYIFNKVIKIFIHLHFDGTAADGPDRFANKVHVHLSGVLF